MPMDPMLLYFRVDICDTGLEMTIIFEICTIELALFSVIALPLESIFWSVKSSKLSSTEKSFLL